MDKFLLEKDGQIDFYKSFLPRVNPTLQLEEIITDNNDGVLNGNLLEFKLNVSDLNAVLFQCIKYLSALRVKGKPVPANILIVDLNKSKVWLYHSEPYLKDIEKTYSGGASKDNSGFVGGEAVRVFRYDESLDAELLIATLKENRFTKIHLDVNCIVGWATAYYKERPTARKEDFIGDDSGKHKTIGEIRHPRVFADYIYPYTDKTNVCFDYLMDRLNDFLNKKNLGAFYTHMSYAEKSVELVRMAIARVPKGNDYVIIDRCAGTGNLERCLTAEEQQHCIVSTVEYYEYKVLLELLGSKVRHIIPPTEMSETFNAGLVTGADALSKEYLESPIIREYIDNPKYTIILFENPPFAETTSIEHQRRGVGTKSSIWKQSFVVSEMKKEVKGAVSNDLGNAFIWSAFKYYLRQPTDSYIVYSPVKYWKAQHLINKQFIKGFAFNKRHFHTNIDACIMCALWGNVDMEVEQLVLEGFDIDKNGKLLIEETNLYVKRLHDLYSARYYEKRAFANASYDGILIGLNGLEADKSVKRRIKPMYSDDMLGYLVADSVGFDNPDAKSSLLIAGRYNGNGFYLSKDNYLEKLPMFAASRYITYNRMWTERGRIMKSADGAARFAKDVKNGTLRQFLLKCLLFTCVEMQNHCRSFIGSDGRYYRNELCLDSTNGETIALKDLKSMTVGDKERAIFHQWKTVMHHAVLCENYNPKLTYGIYQVFAELDTSHKDEKTRKTVYDNEELHSALNALKQLAKNYYNSEIVPTLFDYEFLK